MFENLGLYVGFGVLGCFIGSFLTMVITRYPQILRKRWRDDCAEYCSSLTEKDARSVSWTVPLYSVCDHCQMPLKIWHKIPVMSYFFLRGRCFYCHEMIEPFYCVTECITILISCTIAWHFGLSIKAFSALYFTALIVTLCMIDVRHGILPDRLTLSTLWVGLLWNSTVGGYGVSLPEAVWGSAGGYTLLWMMNQMFVSWRHKEGMGQGDFKFLAMVGAWLGWQGMLCTLWLAVMLGTLWNLILWLSKRVSFDQAIPFGPFIGLSAVIVLLNQSWMLSYFLYLM